MKLQKFSLCLIACLLALTSIAQNEFCSLEIIGPDEEKNYEPNLEPVTIYDCDGLLTFFELNFENDYTDEEKETICQVFQYVETIIVPVQSSVEINVDMRKGAFSNNSNFNNSALAATRVFTVGDCGIGLTRIGFIANKGNIPGFPLLHGEIHINSEKEFHTTEMDNTCTDPVTNDPVLVCPDKNDLYTTVLHEILHSMGFISEVNEGDFTQVGARRFLQYDKFIYGLDQQDYLVIPNTIDPDCCDEHYINVPSFPDPSSLQNGCSGNLAFYDGSNSLGPLNGSLSQVSSGDLINIVSHLDKDCSSASGEDYLMHHSLDEGEARRIITDTEKEILCHLGYDVNFNAPVCDNPCNLLLLSDGPYFIQDGETIEIPILDLLSNDLFPGNYLLSGNIEINCNLSDSQNHGMFGSIMVTLDAINEVFQVTGNLDDPILDPVGVYTFCYTIEGCGVEKCADVQIIVTDIYNTCGATNCDRIDCFGDFENFLPIGSEFPNQANLVEYVFQGTGGNSPETILSGTEPGQIDNQLIHLARGNSVPQPTEIRHQESFYIPLQSSVPPGCTLNVSFKEATRLGGSSPNDPSLLLFASENTPCESPELMACTSGINYCSNSDFTTYCMNINNPNGIPLDGVYPLNGVPAALTWPGLLSPYPYSVDLGRIGFVDSDEMTLEEHSFTWLNNTGVPINYITIYPSLESLNPGDPMPVNADLHVLLDDIIITKTCSNSANADFTFTEPVICGNPVDFTSAQQIGTHDWDFGDSETSADINPNHTYNQFGTFTVIHTVTDEYECEDVETIEIEVLEVSPDAIFTFTLGNCALVQFQSTELGDHLWEFSNGQTETIANPQIDFETSGIHSATHTLSTDCGTDVFELTITIEEFETDPSFTFTFGNCALVQFESTELGDHLWEFSNGQTETIANPQIDFETPGLHSATHTLTNDCGSNSVTEEFTVPSWEIPDASFEAEPENCSKTFQFTSADQTGTHSWNIDGQSFFIPNPSFTFLEPGFYSITHSISSDCASNTETLTVSIIEEPDNSTLLSDAISNGWIPPSTFTNACLLVNGTLVVDALIPNSEYIFENMEIKMGAGAEILVEAQTSLQIFESHVFGCDELWESIEVSTSGSLTIGRNSLIEDAQYGVYANRNCVLSVDNSSFNKNYIGVYVPPSGNLTPQSIVLGAFHGNTFDCNADLLPPFEELEEIPGATGQKTLAGVWVNDLIDFHVGADNATANLSTFRNIRNGIVAINSNLDVRLSRFEDIHTSFDIEEYPDQRTGYGIYADASQVQHHLFLNHTGAGMNDAVVQFNNCDYGIETFKMNSTITDSRMESMDFGIRLNFGVKRKSIIQDNYIEAQNQGIRLWHNALATTIDVSDNILEVTPFPSTNNNIRTGIYMTDAGFPQFNALLYNNEINLHFAHRGIWLESCDGGSTGAGITVDLNTITIDQTVPAKSIGILLDGCKGGLLQENTVEKPIPNGQSFGIQVKNSASTLYCCNTVNGLNTGVQFEGASVSTDNFSATVFEENDWDLRMASGAIIGTQLHRQNLFIGANSSVFLEGDLFDAALSRFTVDHISPNGNPNFLPDIVIPISWFDSDIDNDLTDDPSCTSTPDCNLGGNPNQLTETDEDIKNEELANGNFTDAVQKLAEAYLFQKLKLNPELVEAGSEMEAFLLTKEPTPLGAFYQITQDKTELFIYEEDDQSQIENDLTSIVDFLFDLREKDELLLDATASEASQLIQDKENLNMQLETSYTSHFNFMDGIKTEKETVASQIETENNSVSATEIYDINEKSVNDIYLTSFALNNLTFDEPIILLLESIANQCPYEGGNAIFEARSLLNLISNDYVFDDDELCAPIEERENGEPTFSSEFKSIRIYPNPAKDEITLEYNLKGDENMEVRLFNLLGERMSSNLLIADHNITNISTEPLNSGIYVIKIFNKDKTIFSSKIVIIK